MPEVSFVLNGEPVHAVDAEASLLDVVRREAQLTSVKDGCSPQGQCGCCTVLVDGQPRVACVTGVRRVAGRSVTTVEGLADDAQMTALVESFSTHGASQCGFCTPGILVRLWALDQRRHETHKADVAKALRAHLCRCTGWQTILEAWDGRETATVVEAPRRDRAAAAARAELEGGTPQEVGPEAVLGRVGFAADSAPADVLVAISVGDEWVVAETEAEARRIAGRVQGRRTTEPAAPPIEVPSGSWAHTLATSWVEPGYLETDASWCSPGGEPATPLANGGAFGAKRTSPVGRAARDLADRHGRAVLALMGREDVTRLGPKRPPLAAGANSATDGRIRVARTPGIADAIAAVAPDWSIEEVDVPGPPTSAGIRGAGWAEAAVLLDAVSDGHHEIADPHGGRARAEVDADGIRVWVAAGEPLDEAVLRSYCVGAAHQAYSWVTSESLTVVDGQVKDLTIRSFGIVPAAATPPMSVEVRGRGDPVRGSDAVFAAVAAATWSWVGRVSSWPTGSPGR